MHPAGTLPCSLPVLLTASVGAVDRTAEEGPDQAGMRSKVSESEPLRGAFVSYFAFPRGDRAAPAGRLVRTALVLPLHWQGELEGLLKERCGM